MRAELHPEARLEIRSAALWYDEQTSGAGDRFIAQVTAALIGIEELPLVAFEVQESRVLVLALAHARRRPLYWLHRATDER